VRWAIVALTLATTSVAEAQDAKPITSGPVIGMYAGPIVEKDGPYEFFSVRASTPDASPLPDALRPAVTALLAGYSKGDNSGVSAFLAEGAATRFCPLTKTVICEADKPYNGFGIKDGFRANTPYLMPDQSVRIEWMAGGEVSYLSFLTFSAGKLVLARTAPASMPIKNND
jgi:hypothetical protein